MADKSSLLAYLRRHPGWHVAGDLRSAMGGVPERTLRNWLASLVDAAEIERSGERKGARYRWSSAGRARESDPHEERIFTPESRQLLRRVEAPLYTRPPVSYAEEWVDSYRPNETYYLSEERRSLLRNEGNRPGIQGRAGTYIQKIFNRLIIDLSYNSARLEGNTYTIADTERLVLQGVSAAGKLKEERIMILNHKEAIRYLVQNVAQLAPAEETIRTLHYLLASDLVAPELAGQIRDESIIVSGTTYAPLEGKERLLSLLNVILEKAQLITDPFEASFFLLGHIAYLQPFVDVNKRTSRLASIIPLITNDYVPQAFTDVDKEDYSKSIISFYEFNEVSPLADLYCWSYLRTCQHYDNTVHVVGFDEIAALYRTQRRSLVADVVRELIPPSDAETYVAAHIPGEVSREHREKFLRDVMSEIDNLDASRIAGLGIDRKQLDAWKRLRRDRAGAS